MSQSRHASTSGKIMVADDDRNIVFAFRKAFESRGHTVVSTQDGNRVLQLVRGETPDLLFLDIAMPGMNGLDVLKALRREGLDLPVIVMTGFGTMQTAIQAVRLGAFEYLTKPLDVETLRAVSTRALEMVELRREAHGFRAQPDQPVDGLELIGSDPAMQEIYKTIGSITTTPNSTNVLITGDSGTGKELVARAIHNSGDHANAPFVAINCTVLPEALLETELFGHEKGAFTGAHERKLGKFEVAGKGTLFLDEIGDMPPNLQQKLLRVVEERAFQRLGSTSTIPVEARFVAATNRDVEVHVKKGRFRQDLYFRLNVMTIRVPLLRERRGDIPDLALHFTAKYAAKFGRRVKGLSPDVLDALAHYDYPGNVRELENMIARAVALEKTETLTLESFPPRPLRDAKHGLSDPAQAADTLAEARRTALDGFEREYIENRLRDSHGNVTAAAHAAGIERQSFQRLMKKHGVNSDDFRG